jgi:hypothetical protein
MHHAGSCVLLTPSFPLLKHPGDARVARLLASVRSRDGRLAGAEPLTRRVLAIQEAKLRFNHPDVPETPEAIAKACEQTGRAAEAQGLSARAKRIRAQTAPASS